MLNSRMAKNFSCLVKRWENSGRIYEMLSNLEEFIELIQNLDISIKKFKKNKVVFEDSPNEYLVEFKGILEPINVVNSFIVLELPEYRQYIIYFNNMIMSKLKHFFFREHPIESKNYSKISEDKITMYLRKVFLTEDKSLRKEFLLKYFLFLFLEFDFLYSKKKGYFTSFRMNQKKYLDISKRLKKQLNSIKNTQDTEYKFKKFSVDIIAKIVKNDFDTDNLDSEKVFYDYIEKKKQCLNHQNGANKDNSFFSLITIKNIMKMDNTNKYDVSLEPFTYYISYIMYKDAHILMQVADTKDIDNYVRKYIQNIIELINLFGKFYTEENGTDVAVNIFDKQLELIKKTKLLTRDFILPKRWKDSKRCFIKCFKTEITSQDIDSLDFNQFSLENLLENNIDLLNTLLEAMFISKVMQKDKVSLFATFSSGLFLSVLYKILKHDKQVDIYIFSTFPVSDILPYYVKTDNHQFANIRDAENIVILDDIARSGFTFSLIKHSYKRFTSKELKADFLVLKKSKNLNDTKVKEVNIEKKVNMKIMRKSKIDIINYDDEFSDNFDLNSLFLNRDYSMYIINKFIEKLNDLDEISFFYGSGAGKVFALLVGYFLKNDGKQVYFNKKKENSIFIDLAYNSGFTLKRKMKLQGIEKFKYICVVKNFSKNNSIFSVF